MSTSLLPSYQESEGSLRAPNGRHQGSITRDPINKSLQGQTARYN